MTYTAKVEQKAREGYTEVILPSLQESAERLAEQGLSNLLEVSFQTGKSTTVAWALYNGYSDPVHRSTLARMIRKRVFIDVKVSKKDRGYTFEVAPFYSHNTGSLGYSEPLYRVRRGEREGLYANAVYLRRKKVKDLRSLAFLKVCDFFNITERYTQFISGYTRPSSIDCHWHCDILNLLEVIFITMQKHPKKILDLHESGEHVKVYNHLNFRANDSGDSWSDEKRDGCVAQLARRLLK